MYWRASRRHASNPWPSPGVVPTFRRASPLVTSLSKPNYLVLALKISAQPVCFKSPSVIAFWIFSAHTKATLKPSTLLLQKADSCRAQGLYDYYYYYYY